MKNRISFLLLCCMLLTACSTINSFNQRKYYNFKRLNNADAQKQNLTKEPSERCSSELFTLDNASACSNGIIYLKGVQSVNSIIVKQKDVLIKDAVHTKALIKSAKKFVNYYPLKSITRTTNYLKLKETDGAPKVRGKYWLIWSILAFGFLFITLFVSALIGSIFCVLFLSLAIIGLIKNSKDKRKL